MLWISAVPDVLDRNYFWNGKVSTQWSDGAVLCNGQRKNVQVSINNIKDQQNHLVNMIMEMDAESN